MPTTTTTSTTSVKFNPYQAVTDRIAAMLEAGTIPWRKPWTPGESAQNVVTHKAYRGVNVWLLSSSEHADTRWGTYRQFASLGGQVRKGEKSRMIVFYKMIETREKKSDGTAKVMPFLNYSSVFNVEQADWDSDRPLPTLPHTIDRPTWDISEESERIFANMPSRPSIKHVAQDRAFYVPSLDSITMPLVSQFPSQAHYYATLWHEVSHSTMHESRVNRRVEGGAPPAHFGSESYSREELIAELSAANVLNYLGMDGDVIESNASYIASWLKALRADPNAFVVAANAAHKASDYILGSVMEQQHNAASANVASVEGVCE